MLGWGLYTYTPLLLAFSEFVAFINFINNNTIAPANWATSANAGGNHFNALFAKELIDDLCKLEASARVAAEFAFKIAAGDLAVLGRHPSQHFIAEFRKLEILAHVFVKSPAGSVETLRGNGNGPGDVFAVDCAGAPANRDVCGQPHCVFTCAHAELVALCVGILQSVHLAAEGEIDFLSAGPPVDPFADQPHWAAVSG